MHDGIFRHYFSVSKEKESASLDADRGTMEKGQAFSAEKGLLISGVEFLMDTSIREDETEKLTDRRLPHMGEKGPVCFETIGRVLGQVEVMACCTYGCPGPTTEAHTLHYFCGRTSSFGRAALRLARMGFYDEALSLIRSLGEITNLMGLFFWEKSSLDEWKKSDRKYRQNHFGPAKVRERLSSLSGPIPMGEDRYRILCELSTHPVPDMTPQRFNQYDRSLSGGFFMQDAGFLLVLNEMAVLLACIGVYAAVLLNLPKSVRDEVFANGEKAMDAAGLISLSNFREGLKALKAKVS